MRTRSKRGARGKPILPLACENPFSSRHEQFRPAHFSPLRIFLVENHPDTLK